MKPLYHYNHKFSAKECNGPSRLPFIYGGKYTLLACNITKQGLHLLNSLQNNDETLISTFQYNISVQNLTLQILSTCTCITKIYPLPATFDTFIRCNKKPQH